MARIVAHPLPTLPQPCASLSQASHLARELGCRPFVIPLCPCTVPFGGRAQQKATAIRNTGGQGQDNRLALGRKSR
eukprot:1160242-Pelagomonas_calceolata.AAC.7